MRVAFVIPSFHTRERDWWRFPQIIKLAAPTLAGYLADHGYRDLAHHDFEVQGFDAFRASPRAFDLTLVDDDARVDAFLAGPEEPGAGELRRRARADRRCRGPLAPRSWSGCRGPVLGGDPLHPLG